ncbi:MAG: glycosyltransferase family 2 protein [Bacillota bacterium]
MNDITVIIPAYNAAAYLRESIESAQRALGSQRERIIVVDDGSTDSTFDEARESGVRCIRHASNRGISSALNTGIAAAETKYVAWLSSDDLYTPEAGAVISHYMNRYPDADFYFGDYRQFNNHQEFFPPLVRFALGWDVDGLIEHDWFVDLVFGCFVNGATTIVKRQTALELGLFDTGILYSQDYAMWLLLTYHGYSSVYMNDVVGLRRIHERQLSQQPAVRRAIIKENALLITRFLDDETRARIDRRLTTAPGPEYKHRVELVKRFLHLRLYGEAQHTLFRSPQPALILGSLAIDVLKHVGRRVGTLLRD